MASKLSVAVPCGMFAAGMAFVVPSSLRSGQSIADRGVVEQPCMRGAQASAEADGSTMRFLACGAALFAGAAAVTGVAARKPQKTRVRAIPLPPIDYPVDVPEPPAGMFPANLPKKMWYTGGPLPEDVWDPLNLMEGKTEEQLLYWRAVELKHGRVSMLACLGWFHVAAGYHFIGDAANGYVRVSDDPLVNVTQLPMGGMWQLVFTIMVLEWITTYICKPPKEAPWDILGWEPITIETAQWRMHQLKELNNGRLAMFGIMGLIIQDASGGGYFKEISEACFGQCDPLSWDGSPPFKMEPLYPYQPSN